jgi:hemoglobin
MRQEDQPKGAGVTSSLYDDAGGLDGLRRLSSAFYERVLADDVLAPVFANFTPAHVEHVAVWLAEVFGGPEEYTARLGGHHALLKSHLGLGIRDEQRQRWLRLMADAIDQVFPERPELSTALMGYFEWGTKIAQDVSQDPVGTDLGKPGPSPRWGHQGLIG